MIETQESLYKAHQPVTVKGTTKAKKHAKTK